MITIVIGRDHMSNHLYRKVNDRAQIVKQEKPVPNSVSKEHVSITIHDDGKMVLKNLNAQNYTYVNMVGIESKVIKEGDLIELGTGHYVLDWRNIQAFIPKFADIRPLKKVWEDYQKELMDLTIKEKRFGVLRSVTGVISGGAITLGLIFGRDNPVIIILYIVSALIGAAFFAKAYSECEKIPKQKQAIINAFPHKYVCPNCGHILDIKAYDIICMDKTCKFCHAIYKK